MDDEIPCPHNEEIAREDCRACSGEACWLCGAGCWNNQRTFCEHGVMQRHEPMDTLFMVHLEGCAQWQDCGGPCSCGATKAPWERVARAERVR